MVGFSVIYSIDLCVIKMRIFSDLVEPKRGNME
jgi:hypothetical protein